MSDRDLDHYSQLVGLVRMRDRHGRWTQPAETRQCAPARACGPSVAGRRHIGGVQSRAARASADQCVDLYWIRGCGGGRVDDHEPTLASAGRSPALARSPLNDSTGHAVARQQPLELACAIRVVERDHGHAERARAAVGAGERSGAAGLAGSAGADECDSRARHRQCRWRARSAVRPRPRPRRAGCRPAGRRVLRRCVISCAVHAWLAPRAARSAATSVAATGSIGRGGRAGHGRTAEPAAEQPRERSADRRSSHVAAAKSRAGAACSGRCGNAR